MPLRFSTGAVNGLQEHGSLKKEFWDGVIDIYSGAQPASADDAATGVLLARITLASGAFTAGIRSTQQVDSYTVDTYTGDGSTFAMVINGTTYSYVSSSGDTADTVAAKLADIANLSPVVSCVADGATIMVRALYGGVAYTITKTGTTTEGDITIAAVIANVRINGLQFSASVIGALAKEGGAWSGTALASGTAGYFRFKANAVDDGSGSTILVRMDGNVSTSNAPLIVSSINIVQNTTVTIDSAVITRPKS